MHTNQSVLFTWDEPSASREFVWFVKGSKERITTDLSQVSTLVVVVVVVVVDVFTTLAFFSLFFFRISTYILVTKDLRPGSFDGFCLPIM